MQGSKIVAAALSLAVVAGSALAVARGGDNAVVNAREAVCSNGHLTVAEQADCQSQLQAASSELAKQQVATRFQSKIDFREAVAPAPSPVASAGSDAQR
jgi:hypothetical protein